MSQILIRSILGARMDRSLTLAGTAYMADSVRATPTESLSEQFALLGLDIPIVKGDSPQLRATISGPKGQFTVTS
jgi:hypothetical protein